MNANTTIETLKINADVAAEQTEETTVESLSIAELDMIGGGHVIASFY